MSAKVETKVTRFGPGPALMSWSGGHSIAVPGKGWYCLVAVDGELDHFYGPYKHSGWAARRAKAVELEEQKRKAVEYVMSEQEAFIKIKKEINKLWQGIPQSEAGKAAQRMEEEL